jgi:hypothetical protein
MLLRGSPQQGKVFIDPKACPTPHPLQPVVRPRLWQQTLGQRHVTRRARSVEE